MANRTPKPSEAQSAVPVKNTVKEEQSLYSVDELAEAGPSLFGASPYLVRVALFYDGKTFYTQAEAAKCIEAFKKKEVK